MSLVVWKQIEKSTSYRKAKLFGRRIIGQEPWIRMDCDPCSEVLGGWRFAPAGLSSSSVVYSLGIGKDIRFDQEMIGRFGLTVHAFDPTPSTISWLKTQTLPKNFIFHPWAVSASDGKIDFFPMHSKDGKGSEVMYTMIPECGVKTRLVTVPSYRLQTITTMLNHPQIDLLKIDIEGAEYDVLPNMLEAGITPKQLLIEFHHRLPGIGVKKTKDILACLRSSGYAVFAVSETGREFSFLRR